MQSWLTLNRCQIHDEVELSFRVVSHGHSLLWRPGYAYIHPRQVDVLQTAFVSPRRKSSDSKVAARIDGCAAGVRSGTPSRSVANHLRAQAGRWRTVLKGDGPANGAGPV